MSGRTQTLKTKDRQLPVNVDPYSVEIYGEKYYQIVRLYRAQDTQSADKYSWFLYNDYIEKIEIISELMNPIPMGSLFFSDRGNRLMQKIPTDDCRTFVEITIQKVGEDGTSIETDYAHTYVVTNIEEVSKGHRATSYELHLVSADWVQLNNTLNYSSRGQKPYTEMIEEVFRKMDLSFKTIKNTANNLINNAGHFITATNSTAYRTIKTLLNKSVHSDIGFFFLKHDMLKNMYSIISPKQVFKIQQDTINIDNIINLPTEDMVGFVERTANNLTQKNLLDNNANLNKLKGVNLHYFDYDKRVWKSDSYTPNKIFSDFMPLPQGNVLESKFKPLDVQIKQDVREDQIEHLKLEFDFRDHLSEMFLFTDVIQFESYGVISRSAGDPLILFCPETHPLHKKFSGTWMITRVFHRIVKKEYTNVIQACRVHQYKDNLLITEVQEDEK
jgi:hypothetical protein